MIEHEHNFGGPWTEEKLDRVSGYLQVYSTALKNMFFERIYIDAFAGTGYRASKGEGETVRGLLPLPEITGLVKGSALRALEVKPPFDRYVFIEANLARFQELRKIEDQFPLTAERMTFRNEEANSAIVDICHNTDWTKSRAVMFLDPYGMQVNWSTIQAIGQERHIDLWYLFPMGAVQRLLKRRGEIPVEWQSALDRFLGDSSWRTEFYRTVQEPGLFEARTHEIKVADSSVIEAYVRKRLRQAFKGGVAPGALRLKNSKGSCMYVLLFACGNPSPKAYGLAQRFAQHLLR